MLRFTDSFFVVILLANAGTATAVDVPRPNVLFIAVDDLRTSLGTYGDPTVRSPNIDRLAARGMRFDRAYCQYPVCNPSRSSFLSGLRPEATGVLDNKLPLRQAMPDVVLLPELFRKQGYFTASLGKIIHAGVDTQGRRVFHQDPRSWDDCRNFSPTLTGERGEGRSLLGPDEPWCRWLAAEGDDLDQPDGQIAAEAVKLLEAHRDTPFFMAVGFHKPHDPFIAPKKYFDLYPLDKLPLVSGDAAGFPEVLQAIPSRKRFASWTDQERREFERAYYAGISFTDAQIGKLLDALERLDLWERTIVVLLGDHGYHLGQQGWWNKVTVFETCARAPLIVWAPGTKGQGKPTRGIVEFLDLYPTLADFAGITPPAGLEGRSLRPLLDDPSLPGKPAAFTLVTRGKDIGRSIRTDRWRYTEWSTAASPTSIVASELYDHERDSEETRNLAGESSLRETVADLANQLHAHAARAN